MTFYNVFLIASLGAPRNHHALFVETNGESGGGVIFQVTGNIQGGMRFEEKTCTTKPEDSHTFIERSALGWVDIQNLERMRDICAKNPPRKKQFHGPKRIYPGEPLRRCQEWTAETIVFWSTRECSLDHAKVVVKMSTDVDHRIIGDSTGRVPE